MSENQGGFGVPALADPSIRSVIGADAVLSIINLAIGAAASGALAKLRLDALDGEVRKMAREGRAPTGAELAALARRSAEADARIEAAAARAAGAGSGA